MATAQPQPSPALFDPNLTPVLQRASHELLLPIVQNLASGGITCRLSPEARREPEKHVPELQSEIQKFGGNTFLNVLKGFGVPYQRVVHEVAEQKFTIRSSNKSVFELEEEMLRLFPNNGEQTSTFIELLSRSAPTLTSEGVRRAGFAPYKYAVIIANKCSRFVWKRGLNAATNRAITVALRRTTTALTGPVGWAMTIADLVWTVWKVARPNLEVTQPCVMYIAVLRRALIENELQKLQQINKRKRQNLILPGWAFLKLKNSWAATHIGILVGCIALAFLMHLLVLWTAPIVVWLLSQFHVQSCFQPEINETLVSIEQLQGS
jgi:uncharacterized protein YaaW (UPF0174 family)